MSETGAAAVPTVRVSIDIDRYWGLDSTGPEELNAARAVALGEALKDLDQALDIAALPVQPDWFEKAMGQATSAKKTAPAVSPSYAYVVRAHYSPPALVVWLSAGTAVATTLLLKFLTLVHAWGPTPGDEARARYNEAETVAETAAATAELYASFVSAACQHLGPEDLGPVPGPTGAHRMEAIVRLAEALVEVEAEGL